MPFIRVDLPTADGPCPTYLIRPEPAVGPGPWPAALFCLDGFGVRPALFEMAERIARAGYVVALPDLFHRVGSPLELLPAGTPHDARAMAPMFADADSRERWRSRFFASATDPGHLRVDIGAVLAFLAAQPDVAPGGVGVTGYCMGGNIALRLAALFPERVAAAASFHGGMLASEQPDSPHLGAPRIRARVYVAGAVEDPSFSESAKAQLTRALSDAGVEHVVETYPGARHGFAVPDHAVYDAASAERHYQALFALLEKTLPTKDRGPSGT